jgi:hypothetical protein
MSIALFAVLLLLTPAFAGELPHAASTNILIRLTEISVEFPESGEMLVACFVPISITRSNAFQFGGGSLAKDKRSETVETKTGKEFHVRLFEHPPIKDGPNPHRRTIYNVLKSCAGPQPRLLKLGLVLSVPADATNPDQSNDERGVARWAVESIEAHK